LLPTCQSTSMVASKAAGGSSFGPPPAWLWLPPCTPWSAGQGCWEESPVTSPRDEPATRQRRGRSTSRCLLHLHGPPPPCASERAPTSVRSWATKLGAAQSACHPLGTRACTAAASGDAGAGAAPQVGPTSCAPSSALAAMEASGGLPACELQGGTCGCGGDGGGSSGDPGCGSWASRTPPPAMSWPAGCSMREVEPDAHLRPWS
jgi:hypothetical protein